MKTIIWSGFTLMTEHFKNVAFLFCLTLLSMFSSGALADNYEENIKKWERFIKNNQWGMSQDFWLEKNTSSGWEKVILVFGYGDDYDACSDVKSVLEAKYSAAEYRCMPAN